MVTIFCRQPTWILKFCAALLSMFAVMAISAAESVWVEGESPSESSCQAHPWWYDKVKTDVLSGGAWHSNWHKANAGVAKYKIKIPTAAEYTLWLRANPVKSTMSYRIDGGAWQKINWKRGQRGLMNIAVDNKPDLRFIAWCKVADLKLKSDKHVIEFKYHSQNNNHGAIDCFCLDSGNWVPSGTTKPGEPVGGKAGPADWFAVVADIDEFSNQSVIDMSHLVDAPAGKYGFLQAKGENLQFAQADQPVKFWAVNSNLGRTSDAETMRQRARWYRKHGINLVRQHTVIGAVGLLQDDNTFAADRIQRYDRWFATLKEQGIYSTWSVIYPHHGPFVRPGDVDAELFKLLSAASKHKGAEGAVVSNDWINLSRDLQDYALLYFKALLDHKNPFTGLPYKDDPALAVVEMQNESNVFFHTINSLWEQKPAMLSKSVRKGFHAFVKEKYGDKAGVAKAWDGKWMEQDAWDEGELAAAAPFHWGAKGPLHQYKGQFRRVGDFIAYMASVQRSYYERHYRELRELGFQGVIVTTAWKGVGSSSLANLWCDTAGNMIDRHNYFGGGAGRHRIVEGKVSNATHLRRPGRGLLGLGLFQVADMPFGVSEWSMTPPAPYKAEAAPLVAFYGLGLQGWDASYHFATGAQRLGDGWPGLGKYVSHTPHYMGQFPALAFAVYHGHLKEGPTVAHRRVSEAQLYSGRDELGQSLGQGDHDYKKLGDQVATPPEFLGIGKVSLSFADGNSEFTDPAPYWDRDAKLVRSATGELVWHYGDGYIEVRTPKTQAVIGFAGGRTIKLPGVTVDLKTQFVSLIFTPLDNRPLSESKQILITAMARDKQTGSKYNADWSKLIQVGQPPLLMEPVQATITLDGAKPAKVRPLDIYGVPRDVELDLDADGSFRIDGTSKTYYYEVRR